MRRAYLPVRCRRFEWTPRPLSLNPVTPILREFYLSKGTVPDPARSPWLILSEG